MLTSSISVNILKCKKMWKQLQKHFNTISDPIHAFWTCLNASLSCSSKSRVALGTPIRQTAVFVVVVARPTACPIPEWWAVLSAETSHTPWQEYTICIYIYIHIYILTIIYIYIYTSLPVNQWIFQSNRLKHTRGCRLVHSSIRKKKSRKHPDEDCMPGVCTQGKAPQKCQNHGGSWFTTVSFNPTSWCFGIE